MKAYANAVHHALQDLLKLVRSGVEFPDAAYKAATKYNVQQHHVEQAYDNLEASQNV
jgi:hypothetical protein